MLHVTSLGSDTPGRRYFRLPVSQGARSKLHEHSFYFLSILDTLYSFLTKRFKDSKEVLLAIRRMKVAGHIYYIFGGASGLGEATARRLHQQGAYVAIWDLNEVLANDVVQSLNAAEEFEKMAPEHGASQRALGHKIDVCDTTSILEAIAAADARWKGVPLGGAVVASGVGMVGRTINRDGSPHDFDLFQDIIRINLMGTFNAARLTASRLVRDVSKPVQAPDESTACRGIIITVASQAGLEGQAGQLAYAASKAGVAGMALPMARDLSWYGIRTVSICPTIFETPMSKGMPDRARKLTLKSTEFPARFGRPDEFAHAVQSIIENDMLNGFALSEFLKIGSKPRSLA